MKKFIFYLTFFLSIFIFTLLTLYISDFLLKKLFIVIFVFSLVLTIGYFGIFYKLKFIVSLENIRKVDLLYLFLFGVAACILVSEVIYYRLPVHNRLEIISTGEQRIISKGAEVWLLKRKQDFGANFDIGDISFSGGWIQKDGDAVAVRYPAVAKWSGWSYLNGQIFFLKHPWSGKVLVKWGKSQNVYDLYSPDRGYQEVILPKESNTLAIFIIKVCAGVMTFHLLVLSAVLMHFLSTKRRDQVLR